MTPGRTATAYPDTPDGRYFVVRGRLWRKSNPALEEEVGQRLVKELMSARRAVRDAKDDPSAMAEARRGVHDAKVALGERGPVWWTDGEPDLNRHSSRIRPMPLGLQSCKMSEPRIGSDPGTTCCIDHLTSRPACLVRSQEGDDISDILRPADT